MVELNDQINGTVTRVPTRSHHLCVQDDILRNNHLKLRQKLNFRAIYPYLNECRLLPPFFDQLKFVDGVTTEQERIDAVVVHLTTCKKQDYLQDFISCLKRSKDGTGDGHLELAQSLEAAYAIADESDYSNIQAESDSETNARRWCTKKCFLICGCACTLPLLVLLLLPIISLGTLSGIPTINTNPGPDMVRPLLTNRPNKNEQTRILEVDFGIDPFWIAQADFQIEDCTGTTVIVRGAECHELPINVIEHVASLPILYYAYLLPGSVVNITVVDTITESDLQIWRLNSQSWLHTNLGRDLGSCDNPPPGSICLSAQSNAGETIEQKIEKADFYFYLSNPFSFDVTFTYVEKQYNFTAIYEQYNPTQTTIIRDRSQTVTISSSFDFQQRKCVLLSSACQETRSYAIKINNIRRRMDVLLPPGVVGIVAVLATTSVISVYIIALVVWPKLKKKCSGIE